MILTEFQQWWSLWRSQHERADAGECVIAVRDFYEGREPKSAFLTAAAFPAAANIVEKHSNFAVRAGQLSTVQDILALTPAEAQRLYDLRIAEAVRDECQWFALNIEYSESSGDYVEKRLASASAEVERLKEKYD